MFQRPFRSLWNRFWRWLITYTHTTDYAHRHFPILTQTKIYTHAQLLAHMQGTKTSTGTPRELHRWCLVWGLHSTSKGHLWHLRSLTNDDAQRSFATTKTEQKNWHEREVNKHKAFNKTFFSAEFTTKVFTIFFSLTRQTKKKQKRWVTWLTEKSGCNPVFFNRDWPAPVVSQKYEGNWRQRY